MDDSRSSLSRLRPNTVTKSLTPSLDGSRRRRFMPATPSPPSVSNTSSRIWCRLGHPSNQVVDVLHHDLNFTKDSQVSPCDICHKAKQTREPFPFIDHQTTIIDEIIHLHLWGPYKVISKDGYIYILTIVDDYTRAVWVYLVKTKDEVYDLFVSFVNPIPNQFKCNIKTMSPNDNGRGSVTPNDDGNVHPCTRSSNTSDDSEDDFATSMGDNSNSEGNVLTFSVLNTQRNLPENSSLVQPNIRKSSRSIKMLAKFKDYVVGSSRKYRLENITYSKLTASNFCLCTTLNKSYEPNTYYEAIKNPNWIEAMNKEIEANTSTICDHPEGRKLVGSKWLHKIKYKSIREIERYKEKASCQGLQPEGGI
uniref:Ribonuclease H-like domain-containing protein n=1 Tax=Tanacetum cinerariifolium TaxID=118510 RepID=A0A6L2KDB1_TANCI|nr:ribonuclease H-like domain-containing protein [Tanacetum cinerariifolium]